MENNNEQPVVLKISKVIEEAADRKSFVFKYNMKANPGQFILLWIPGLDEKPFGVSYQDEDKFAVTVCRVGRFTERLFESKAGDQVGIRGPYGKHFSIPKNISEAVLVGGGYGVAPLAFLADELVKKGVNVRFFIGAREEKYVLFRKRFRDFDMHYATDDGSYGYHGYITEVLEKELIKRKADIIYTCGPELMMKKVISLSDEYGCDCQLSMERYFKCGIGVCGSCVVDHLGIRLCKEGPVISKNLAKQIYEFGKYKRKASGKINKI